MSNSGFKFSKKEISDNHQEYQKRKRLYSQYGCDIDVERAFILKQAGDISGRILEIGTGKGYFSVMLALKGYSFTSCDISEEELRYARLNLAYYNFGNFAELCTENAESLSFENGLFNVIFSVNTLHHIDNIWIVLDEMCRVLSDSGKIILSDFTEKGFCVIDKIQAINGKTHDRGNVSFSQIKKYLTNKGFDVSEAESVHQHVLKAERITLE